VYTTKRGTRAPKPEMGPTLPPPISAKKKNALEAKIQRELAELERSGQ
jgi:hypothetical protein